MASNVRDRMPAGSNVLITEHSACICALEDLRRGLLGALAGKRLSVQRLVTGIDPHFAAALISRFIGKHPDTRVIVATGEADATGTILVTRENLGDLHNSADNGVR